MPASQLTTDERYQITYLHMHGHSNAEIGRRLGRDRATIGRELARNADPIGGYHYLSAQGFQAFDVLIDRAGANGTTAW